MTELVSYQFEDGIATLTLHTAGNHNASVSLPGLGEALAREMREEIRAHIRRETM